jgi:hypothetical protein
MDEIWCVAIADTNTSENTESKIQLTQNLFPGVIILSWFLLYIWSIIEKVLFILTKQTFQ